MADANEYIRYQPDENPPFLECLTLGLQSTLGRLTGLAASTAIVAQASGQPDSYLAWIFFISLIACGLGTMLQTFRIWRFGSGYALNVSNGSAFIAVCISALVAGGPAMLSSLMLVSSGVQFALVSRLALLRRIVTPPVTGTILMLLAATVITVLLGRMSITPEGVPQFAAPVVAGATAVTVLGVIFFGSSRLRQMVQLIGIGVGCVVAVPLGLFDARAVVDAAWVGIPIGSWPEFDFNLGIAFWALLPGFVVVNLATSLYGLSDIVAIQQSVWRRARATDFRVVQGAFNAVGVTNLFTAVLGGLPNLITPGNTNRAMITGVASRRVGLYGGGILLLVGCMPKFTAIFTAIPVAVFAGYVSVSLSLLFVRGMQMVVRGGVDPRKAATVGVSFWLGVGFQNGLILPDLLGGTWGTLLGNGLTTGSISLIVLTLLLEFTGPRRARLNTGLDSDAYPRIDSFLQGFASRAGWDEASTERLRSAGEETLTCLLPVDGDGTGGRLRVNARQVEDNRAELEFVAAAADENLEDRLALLDDQPEVHEGEELSFRLLRHYASTVQHRKFHEADVITVEVQGSR